jgi:hypothetical protein
MNSMFEVLLGSLISSLPQVAIATVGLVLIHLRLRRLHPGAHLYGTIGFALLLANGLLGVAIRAYVTYAKDSYDPVALAKMFTTTNLVSFVVLSVSLVLILVALLADRDPPKSSRVAA